MGIPLRNREGYKDPTAAEAINNVEKSQKGISVGCMVEYKGDEYKVEYIGWHKLRAVVKLEGVNGLIPIVEVRRVNG